MKVEMGKHYRTRDGKEVRIYATDGDGDYPVHGAIHVDGKWHPESWTAEGRLYHECEFEDAPDGSQNCEDLVEVKPRIKQEVWVNVYGQRVPGGCYGYATRAEADENAARYRKACVRVEIDCEEGEGL